MEALGSNNATDLLTMLLQYDPDRRVVCQQALHHHYFSESRIRVYKLMTTGWRFYLMIAFVTVLTVSEMEDHKIELGYLATSCWGCSGWIHRLSCCQTQLGVAVPQ